MITGCLRDTLVSLSVLTASVMSMNEFLLVDVLHKDPSSLVDTVVSFESAHYIFIFKARYQKTKG